MKEADIQKAFFRWVAYNPKIRALTFAIPNGGKRDVKEASHLKAQGVRSGVPDVFMAHPSSQYHGLFIEFKAKKNKLTENQEIWFKSLESKGYKCIVCYSLEDAIKFIEHYLTLEY